MSTLPKMLPCPFCGKRPLLRDEVYCDSPLVVIWYVSCKTKDCYCNTPIVDFEDQTEAITAWNKRA